MKQIFTFLCLLAVSSYAMAQTVYFQEDLEEGLPADWTIANDDGGWVVGDAATVSSAYFGIPDIGEGQMACFNDDGLGGDHAGGGTLTTGSIDLTSVTGDVTIEMHHYFLNGDYQGADEVAIVNVSTDGGMTWTEFADLDTGGGYIVWFEDFSAYAGETVMLQFSYDDGDGWNFGWAFDNLTIADQVTLIPEREFQLHVGGASLVNRAEVGASYVNHGWVFNNGTEEITSFDLNFDNGSESFDVNVTGVSVPFGGFYAYAADPIEVAGDQSWTVTLSNVNGSMDADEDPSNDQMSFNLNAVTPSVGRTVVIEESTGTWCQFCPRGLIYLDELAERFPTSFAGVGVHIGDPMENLDYDGDMSSFPGFLGYPTAIYERTNIVEFNAAEAAIVADITEDPIATLDINASLSGNTLSTSMDVNFWGNVTGDHKVAIVVTEDGLSGTDGAWDQVNAYSGGGLGEMGGYEILPNSVPGLVYNHVAIGQIGDYDGIDGPSGSFTVFDVESFDFSDWTIPAGANTDNIHLVGLLLDADGKIVNAKSTSLDDAVSIERVEGTDVAVNVFPNPVNDNAQLQLNLANASEVVVTITSITGQVMSSTNFGVISGATNLELDMADFASGMYTIQILAGDQLMVEKVTKK